MNDHVIDSKVFQIGRIVSMDYSLVAGPMTQDKVTSRAVLIMLDGPCPT